MARQQHGEAKIIGMAGRDEVPAMQEFVQRHDLGHVRHLVDESGDLWARFEVPGQPAWVFLDRSGQVSSRAFGPLTADEFAARIGAAGA